MILEKKVGYKKIIKKVDKKVGVKKMILEKKLGV